mmetsp:Transcript_23371/g.34497  ORF Transcript_23371/g.34497 Transcript_23371/m.34497 type:complete len:148 (-) Transcript_23371:522-965(-)|eukprot:CAMPEP_0194231740 /NCGR_PEP_ID=MMETSP0158-20130606/370_1 /TAXON_ID=33649 /ORGANISM="Thalassionema nitzschioides, Strain L26-B" /LENGTH=147 /DNA_ID=CAMNT_0038964409 /DNA_START=39 /DNA_END=482 /DNA_ORIENTATION=-
MLFVKAVISLLVVHAVAAKSYVRLGQSCDDVDLTSRIEGSTFFFTQQQVKEACNEDDFCHGFIEFSGLFLMVDSIGDLGDFRNSCTGFTAYMANELPTGGLDSCVDTNRHADKPKSCRPFAENLASCDQSSAAKVHCCACGGGENFE